MSRIQSIVARNNLTEPTTQFPVWKIHFLFGFWISCLVCLFISFLTNHYVINKLPLCAMNFPLYFLSNLAMMYLWPLTSSIKLWNKNLLKKPFIINSQSSLTRLFTQSHNETIHFEIKNTSNNEETLIFNQENIRKRYPIYKSSNLFGGYYTILECPQPSEFSILDHPTFTTLSKSVDTYDTSVLKSTVKLTNGTSLVNQTVIYDSEMQQDDESLRTSLLKVSNIKQKSNPIISEQMSVHPDEIEFSRRKEERNLRRANIFIGGRIALRSSVDHLKSPDLVSVPPILSNEFGAPLLPPSISGSVSHKGNLAVGFVREGSEYRVGVDIEKCYNKASDRLYHKILTPSERNQIGKLADINITYEEEIMLLFSFKEAVYKAIHPTVRRSVSFQEVSTTALANGSATFEFDFKSDEIFRMMGSWEKMSHSSGNYFVTFVSAKHLS